VPPRKSSGGGSRWVGIGAAIAATALVAGTVGGAVGFTAARLTAPESTTTIIDGGGSAGTAQPPSPVANNSIAGVAEALQPSVVQLNVSGNGSAGTGSGFVIREDGYILTNNHVTSGGSSIEISFADGSTARGELIGANPGYDLAVVKVDRVDLQERLGFVTRSPRWAVAFKYPPPRVTTRLDDVRFLLSFLRSLMRPFLRARIASSRRIIISTN
jgi:putative serine protease PepD